MVYPYGMTFILYVVAAYFIFLGLCYLYGRGQ